jgi:hypothetical protein
VEECEDDYSEDIDTVNFDFYPYFLPVFCKSPIMSKPKANAKPKPKPQAKPKFVKIENDFDDDDADDILSSLANM